MLYHIYLYLYDYYSTLKKENPTICYNMYKLGWHYADWNKPDTEEQILQHPTFTRNLLISGN